MTEIRDSGFGIRKWRSVAVGAMWLLVGVGLTLFLVADPIGVSPVDEWMGIHHESTGGNPASPEGFAGTGGIGLWTCGMHPEVLQDEPGMCPICQMDLVPVGDPASPEGSAGTSGGGDSSWTCPMHPMIEEEDPEVLQDEPGMCPICQMDLVPVGDQDGNGNGHGNGHGGAIWTCPMHPMIEEEDPGECPICGMELVQNVESGGQERAVTIDPAVVQTMNVSIEQVERRDLTRRVRTVGHLDYDQEAMVSVTTRYSGFVERVFADSVGQKVRRGEPLFEVYAPELVQTQRELLSALEYAENLAGTSPEVRRRAEQLVEAARTRMAYWDVTSEQIAAIESNGEVLRSLQVVSPISGVIMKRLHGLEGMAISPGMDVIHVADISKLWLTVEVFEEQLPWISEGSTARVRLDYFPGETITARVRFIEPEVSPQTRSVRLTLEVPNHRGRLRVGMYATVEFEPVVARDAVVVPSQAVIRSGARDVVVLDLGDGRFAPREITVGVQSDGLLQVLEGLDGSERIVTSAQFLIDSESNLRAAIDKLRAGHNHGGGS